MKQNTRKITGLGILTAAVIVLQLLSTVIQFGIFNITLALVPIIIGAALYGVGAGAWLGFVFSVVVLLQPATATFLTPMPVQTVLIVILKGTLAGLASAFVYKLVAKKGDLPAVICAGITAPVVNTGIFILGSYLFFMPIIEQIAASQKVANAAMFVITGMVGLNFPVELAVNMVLASAIVKIISIIRKNSGNNTKTIKIEVDGDIKDISVEE